MKVQHYIHTLLLLCCCSLYNIAYAATPSARMLANTCAGCHGTDGSSVGPASPTIAGISQHDGLHVLL